jgi:hypothetical protein
MHRFVFCSLLMVSFIITRAQLTIDRNAVLYIQQRASVYVEGNLLSESNIEGEGHIELGGKRKALIAMNGFSISNLLINARDYRVLGSDLRVTSGLVLKSGHIKLDNNSVILEENAVVTGSKNGYLLTTGTGRVKKLSLANLRNYFVPLGTLRAYMPMELNASGPARYGFLSVKASDEASAHRPVQVKDYLKSHWLIWQDGSWKDITVSGGYEPGDIEGRVGQLSAYYWDGVAWHRQADNNPIYRKITAQVTSLAGELYAMSERFEGISSSKLKLLNNPARSFTVLEIIEQAENTYDVVLHDVSGRVLQQTEIRVKKGINRYAFSLEGLAKGPYFLDVSTRIERQSLKFVKIE